MDLKLRQDGLFASAKNRYAWLAELQVYMVCNNYTIINYWHTNASEKILKSSFLTKIKLDLKKNENLITVHPKQ